MLTLLRRTIQVGATVVAIVMLVAASAVWWIARDNVSQLRVALSASPPLTPAVRTAIIAAEDPVLDVRPRFSLLALLPPRKNTVRCGPSPIAFMAVRSVSTPRRAWRWHAENAIATYAVASTFSPEELLRIYAGTVYLGKVQGRAVTGVDDASSVYFHKTARELTVAEAATLAAMIRSPHAYSPVKYPARTVDRRNKILQRMHQAGAIDDHQWQQAIGQPLRLSTATVG